MYGYVYVCVYVCVCVREYCAYTPQLSSKLLEACNVPSSQGLRSSDRKGIESGPFLKGWV